MKSNYAHTAFTRDRLGSKQSSQDPAIEAFHRHRLVAWFRRPQSVRAAQARLGTAIQENHRDSNAKLCLRRPAYAEQSQSLKFKSSSNSHSVLSSSTLDRELKSFMAIKLHRYALYLIPSDHSSPSQETILGDNAVDSYLSELLGFLGSESSVRKFFFPNDRCPEARTKLLELPEESSFGAAVGVLAKRLHETQQATEQGPIKVQVGSFLTVHYESGDKQYVLLAKLEQMNFLSRATWNRESGFPFDKNRLLKTCLCELKQTGSVWEIGDVSIYDSNTSISRFWWRDFLELLELTDDAKNSQRAYNAWKSMLETTVRPKSKVDYHILHNAVGFYFRNPRSYVHKDAVEQLLGSYNPEEPNLNVTAIRARAEKLPSQSEALDKRFDERFMVDPKACNIRIRPIKLTDEIDLVLKKPLEHLSEVIKRARLDGKEGVFVVSSEGYRQLSP